MYDRLDTEASVITPYGADSSLSNLQNLTAIAFAQPYICFKRKKCKKITRMNPDVYFWTWYYDTCLLKQETP